MLVTFRRSFDQLWPSEQDVAQVLSTLALPGIVMFEAQASRTQSGKAQQIDAVLWTPHLAAAIEVKGVKNEVCGHVTTDPTGPWLVDGTPLDLYLHDGDANPVSQTEESATAIKNTLARGGVGKYFISALVVLVPRPGKRLETPEPPKKRQNMVRSISTSITDVARWEQSLGYLPSDSRIWTVDKVLEAMEKLGMAPDRLPSTEVLRAQGFSDTATAERQGALKPAIAKRLDPTTPTECLEAKSAEQSSRAAPVSSTDNPAARKVFVDRSPVIQNRVPKDTPSVVSNPTSIQDVPPASSTPQDAGATPQPAVDFAAEVRKWASLPGWLRRWVRRLRIPRKACAAGVVVILVGAASWSAGPSLMQLISDLVKISPPGTVEPVQFMTPSNNIGCAIGADQFGRFVRCDVRAGRFTPPPPPPSCPLKDWGTTFVIRTDGPPRFDCASNFLLDGPPAPVQPYGSTVSSMGFSCSIETTGVKCSRRNTTMSFTVSQQSFSFSDK
ncbi:nuclease-related domain-containing protein [Rhodococcus sp. 14-2483-1-2]|uniref:nuclease-related domain-containing protein n=1 Tax=Rhodococcus sp. 14-2483-1-2 TaxID=2023147 RepID=UPI00148316B1|nr:nuclease-related domain-containing protein [Rhodococcus sp. 14-2483-1-2]